MIGLLSSKFDSLNSDKICIFTIHIYSASVSRYCRCSLVKPCVPCVCRAVRGQGRVLAGRCLDSIDSLTVSAELAKGDLIAVPRVGVDRAVTLDAILRPFFRLQQSLSNNNIFSIYHSSPSSSLSSTSAAAHSAFDLSPTQVDLAAGAKFI